ncbi:fluoride efflux transporter CrcB [Actinoplanes sp. TRM 88003]|uniref:Fluoride-specific ion channel FluC n=1 Tax=Paractinoplanes aksuensis TaxID=2939490 RepID=A0ABT1DU39_9ACTN|nr:fluoride efflux transporter CrcB [Actinoplanes aksuensis]MCO8273460.1 fluoride efflux transporter CrcB [Actinoplanes aksuensis]
MTPLLVALGAAVGAPLRYLTDQALRHRAGTFPLGTFVVNIAGSLLLGFLIGVPVSDAAWSLLGVGFCGALTTYSTFSLEALTLFESGERLKAFAYVVTSLAVGLAAASLGHLAGTAL